MKSVPLSEVKDDLSKFLRKAEKQALVITRHGKPAGVLIGFANDDEWFEYRLLNDPRFSTAWRMRAGGSATAVECAWKTLICQASRGSAKAHTNFSLAFCDQDGIIEPLDSFRRSRNVYVATML